jgi:hypothetical protein
MEIQDEVILSILEYLGAEMGNFLLVTYRKFSAGSILPEDIKERLQRASCRKIRERIWTGDFSEYYVLPDGKKHGAYDAKSKKWAGREYGQYDNGNRVGDFRTYNLHKKGLEQVEKIRYYNDGYGYGTLWDDRSSNGMMSPIFIGQYRNNHEYGVQLHFRDRKVHSLSLYACHGRRIISIDFDQNGGSTAYVPIESKSKVIITWHYKHGIIGTEPMPYYLPTPICKKSMIKIKKVRKHSIFKSKK